MRHFFIIMRFPGLHDIFKGFLSNEAPETNTAKTKSPHMSLDEIIRKRGIGGLSGSTSWKRKRSSCEDMSLSEYMNVDLKHGDEGIFSKSLAEIILTRKRKSLLGSNNNSNNNSNSCKNSPQKETLKDDFSAVATTTTTIPWPKKMRQMDATVSAPSTTGGAISVDSLEERPKEASYTPESCLRFLSEAGFFFDIEVWEMKDKEHAEYSRRRWRVQVYDGTDDTGDIKGVGEAPRKQLAKDSAILDLIEKLKIHKPQLLVPNCQIHKSALISPFVLLALERACEAQGFRSPAYTEELVVVKDREKVKFTIYVDSQQFQYSSTNFKYAKLGAAKKAFEGLSGRPFRLDEVLIGDDCLDEKEFVLLETEQLNIIHTSTQLPTRSLTLSEMIPSSAPISGATTPTSTSRSPVPIKIATISQPEMPPFLTKIRNQILAQTKDKHDINQLIEAAHSEAAGLYTKIIPPRLVMQ